MAADVYQKIFASQPIRNGSTAVFNGCGPNSASGINILSQPFSAGPASGTFDREYDLTNIDGYAFAGENLSNLYKHSYLGTGGSGVP